MDLPEGRWSSDGRWSPIGAAHLSGSRYCLMSLKMLMIMTGLLVITDNIFHHPQIQNFHLNLIIRFEFVKIFIRYCTVFLHYLWNLVYEIFTTHSYCVKMGKKTIKLF